MGKKQGGRGEHLYLLFACIIAIPLLMSGCTHLYQGFLTGPDLREAKDFAIQGDYGASLNRYEQIMARHPQVGDRVLLEMGFIYGAPRNQQKDYKKSLDCFQKLIKDYPQSEYRQAGDVMIFLLNERASLMDERVNLLHERANLVEEIQNRDKRMGSQKRQIDRLEQQMEEYGKTIEQLKEVDMNLKQKKKPLP